MLRISWVAAQLAASQEGLSSMSECRYRSSAKFDTVNTGWNNAVYLFLAYFTNRDWFLHLVSIETTSRQTEKHYPVETNYNHLTLSPGITPLLSIPSGKSSDKICMVGRGPVMHETDNLYLAFCVTTWLFRSYRNYTTDEYESNDRNPSSITTNRSKYQGESVNRSQMEVKQL
jgi:hypothetical protein